MKGDAFDRHGTNDVWLGPVAAGWRSKQEGSVDQGAGRYRIRAVAERTGVAVATLRAWERRYGIPTPARSEAAYRLYGERDLAQIARLKALCASGLALAEAARIVREEGLPVAAQAAPTVAGAKGSRFAGVRAELLRAAAAFDPERAEATLRGALPLGSAHELFAEVVAPVLTAIGEQWERGELAIAQEHVVSSLFEGLSYELLRSVQPRVPARQALLACWRHELHVLPLLGVALRLAELGWRTVLLGARTPPSAVAQAVVRQRPAVVGLSLTVAPPPAELADDLSGYAQACGTVPWLVGGRAAVEQRSAVAASGGRVVTSLADLERALGSVRRPTAATGRRRAR